MLKIKLKRIGRKKQPFYKIIITENLYKLTKKFALDIGYYNPFTKIIKLNLIKLYNAIKNGAYPTNSVRHLIYKYI